MVVLKEFVPDGKLTMPIPSYYAEKIKEAKEAELKHDSELKEVFLKALLYYNQNYPNSKYKIKYETKKELLVLDTEKVFKDVLNCLTEAQLLVARTVLIYALQEKIHNQNMTIRDLYFETKGRISQLIPGSRYLDEEDKLKKEIYEKEKRQKEIEEFKTKERKAIEERIQKLRTEAQKPIEIPKETTKTIDIPKVVDKSTVTITQPNQEVQPVKTYICTKCNDNINYQTGSGLASHMRHKHSGEPQ